MNYPLGICQILLLLDVLQRLSRKVIVWLVYSFGVNVGQVLMQPKITTNMVVPTLALMKSLRKNLMIPLNAKWQQEWIQPITSIELLLVVSISD